MKDATGKQLSFDECKTFVGNCISKTIKSITLYTKDLEPQISWRTVFIIECFGPLLVHQLFYLFSSVNGKGSFTRNYTQFVAYVSVLLHFLKREFETVFISSRMLPYQCSIFLRTHPTIGFYLDSICRSLFKVLLLITHHTRLK